MSDPAGLSVTVLLAGWMGQWFKDEINYAGAMQDLLDICWRLRHIRWAHI